MWSFGLCHLRTHGWLRLHDAVCRGLLVRSGVKVCLGFKWRIWLAAWKLRWWRTGLGHSLGTHGVSSQTRAEVKCTIITASYSPGIGGSCCTEKTKHETLFSFWSLEARGTSRFNVCKLWYGDSCLLYWLPRLCSIEWYRYMKNNLENVADRRELLWSSVFHICIGR